jgi:hypothetical protein
MSWKSIRVEILQNVVDSLDHVFSTKDVSEDVSFWDAHLDLAAHRNYHAFVGQSLSHHRALLGIRETKKDTDRGSLWERQKEATMPIQPLVNTVAAFPRADADTLPPLRSQSLIELGPQCRSDSRFAARMRLHQSWYRTVVLGVPYGTGPKSIDTTFYGNILKREHGAVGLNFLTPEIAQAARDRVAQGGGTVEPFRLFHNMLSSQPMCFNLFGPLIQNHDLARRLFSAILPDPVSELTRVTIEWAPEPSDDYLSDRTAFDAFLEFRDADGRLHALGVETKLVEPFSQKKYDGERYRRWMRVQGSPWRPDADDVVCHPRHNQLWRDHLLSVALRNQPGSPYATSRLMLIRHPGDPDCAEVLAGYRGLLREGDTSLIDMPLDRLVDAWASVIGKGKESGWITAFRTRYLDLHTSAGL